MWEWYVIVVRSIRFERLVNSSFSSSDDEPQEFALRDPFVDYSKVNSPCPEQRVDAREHVKRSF